MRKGDRSRGARAVIQVVLPVVFVAATWVAVREFRALQTKVEHRGRLAAAAELDRKARADQFRVWSVALKTDPRSAMALAQLAALHVQRARESGDESNYVAAELLARRSLELRTNRNAKTYVTLASTLLAQHRFAEAREAAASALALGPEVVQYRALLAEIDMELGDYDAARRGFAGLQPYATHLSIGPRLARWAEVSGNDLYARRLLRGLVDEATRRRELPREQLAWFHFRLGDHYRRHGKPRLAREALRLALEVNPGDYRALKAMSELDLSQGDAEAALSNGFRATEISRTPETLLTLANAYRMAGELVDARVLEREVSVALGADAQFERAWYAYRLDWGISVPELVPLLERESVARPDVQGLDLLAWAYYKTNRFPEARATIRRALRTETSDASVWFHAGMISSAVGDTAGARANLERALKLDPALGHRHRAVVRELLRGRRAA